MSSEWVVDTRLPWEIVGTRYDDGKLTQIHLRKRHDPGDQSMSPPERATIRVKDGALIVVREGA